MNEELKPDNQNLEREEPKFEIPFPGKVVEICWMV
jgi:hypothetical protein